jgi:hypothetical protein
MPEIIKEFKMRTKVQVVNVSILTDGESTTHLMYKKEFSSGIEYQDITNSAHFGKTFICHGQKSYLVGDTKTDSGAAYLERLPLVTNRMLHMIKEVSGVNLMGFFLMPITKSSITKNYYVIFPGIKYSELETLTETIMKDSKTGSAMVKGFGYDEMYIIKPERFSTEDPFEFQKQDDEKENLKAIKKAIKQIGGRKQRLSILNQFTTLISKNVA